MRKPKVSEPADEPVTWQELSDLRRRMARAVVGLRLRADEAEDPARTLHMRGQSEGVRLAMSYLDEFTRREP